MFLQADALSRQTVEADICIIGGGVAGITIAASLLASGKKIVLLESGGLEPDRETQALYQGRSAAQHYDTMSTRLRWFGGTSNHWEGMCMALAPEDMRPRPWVPHSGWPIEWQQLKGYYEKAASLLQLPDDSPPPAFDSPGPMLQARQWRFAKRLQFGESYKAAFEKAANAHVVFGANVTNIHLGEGGGEVAHVEAKSLDGASFKVVARNYVLACGGLENARILLYSNDVMPAGVGNAHDVVGRYFMEHPHHKAATLYSFGPPAFMEPFRENIRWRQPIATRQAPDAMMCLAVSADAQRQQKILNASFTLSQQKANVRGDDPVLDYMRALMSDKEGVSLYASEVFVRSEQAPNPQSRVMLDPNTRDALGLPGMVVEWKLQDIDLQTIRQSMYMMARHVPAKTGIVRLEGWLRDSASWPRHLGWGCHHMGTTRMGDDLMTSVVDKQCRVHGTDNLYIAGSSVFPSSGFANPTMTIVALALRMADQLSAAN